MRRQVSPYQNHCLSYEKAVCLSADFLVFKRAEDSVRVIQLKGNPHDHRRHQESDRPHLGRLLVRRHLQSARSDRADHLPALPAPARRPAHARGEQGRPAQAADGASDLPGRARIRKGRPYEDLRWSRFKNFAPAEMYTVVGEHVFPFLRTLGGDGLHLRPPHEGRALHHPDAGAAGQGRGPARQRADGGPRHQGRSLRVHARQDRHRRAERPVPHAAPHHPADGRDDRADSPTT